MCLTHTWKGSEAWQVNGQKNGEGQGEAARAEGTSWLKSKRKRELGALRQVGPISDCSETPGKTETRISRGVTGWKETDTQVCRFQGEVFHGPQILRR